MKPKSLFFFVPLLALTSISGGLTNLFNKPIEVKAEASNYSNSTLTKTIDLNPVSSAEVRSYYASLDGKSLSGEDLLKALKPILREGQQYHSYDSGSSIWQAYEITDRDWTLSPASQITNGTYDPNTNKITGYRYGSNANKLDNPYLHVLYRNPGVEEGYLHAWDHHGDNNGIDREHIWAKSRGFGKDDSGTEVKVPGARGDLHHLLPGDSYVNSSTHSNNPYGFVDKNKIDDDAGKKYTINGVTVVDGNYRGTSSSIGSGIVFEPQDSDKGDIARACFYMVARYNNLALDDNSIDAGNPNLTLSDEISDATVYSTPTKAVSYGVLRDLLAWHKLDPVDEYEIHRNDIIYRNYDHNRNPFIDFPSWVDAIWGEVELGADRHSVASFDYTPKGVASPKSDNLYEGGSPIAPVSSSESSAASNSSSSQEQAKENKVAIPVYIFVIIAVAAAILLLILILLSKKGKGKTKKVAKKAVDNVKKTVKKSAKGGSKGKTTKKK